MYIVYFLALLMQSFSQAQSCQKGNFSLKTLGPLIGTYSLSDGNFSYGSLYTTGILTLSGEVVGSVKLVYTQWPSRDSLDEVTVTKLKYFTLFGQGQISAAGTVQSPSMSSAANVSQSTTFIIPVTGGTGSYFGALGELNTTSILGSPNQVIYTLTIITPTL